MTFLVIGVLALATVIAIFAIARANKRNSRTSPPRVRPPRVSRGTSSPGGEHISPDETDDERRLRRLREFQRAEKIREAAEEVELAERLDDVREQIDDENDLRMLQLREFQRAEKLREAAEDLERFGPEPEIEQPIGTLITQELVELRHDEAEFDKRQQENFDRAEMSRVVGEARDLVVDMNAQYGWQPGEPSIPDRLFNTDVESVLGAAVSRGKVDFRTHQMVATMRSFARAQTGGRNELAKVMATRVLLGSGRLTEEELSKLNGARRLFGDDYAEAAGFVDHLTRQQELIEAKKLGLAATREHAADRDDFGIERNR
jgi:hypothetical protein